MVSNLSQHLEAASSPSPKEERRVCTTSPSIGQENGGQGPRPSGKFRIWWGLQTSAYQDFCSCGNYSIVTVTNSFHVERVKIYRCTVLYILFQAYEGDYLLGISKIESTRTRRPWVWIWQRMSWRRGKWQSDPCVGQKGQSRPSTKEQRDANLLAIHDGRVALQPQDTQQARRTWGDKDWDITDYTD